MADKYIWHDTTIDDFNQFAKTFNLIDGSVIEEGTFEHDMLCGMLGCYDIQASAGCYIQMIHRINSWYLTSEGDLTFILSNDTSKTFDKIHIRTRDGSDTIKTNERVVTFAYRELEDARAICEFNYTTRDKKEGYGYQDGDEEIFPLKNTWNGRYDKREVTDHKGAVRIGTSQESVLYPFNGVKLCAVGNYNNSEDFSTTEGGKTANASGVIGAVADVLVNEQVPEGPQGYIGAYLGPGVYVPGYATEGERIAYSGYDISREQDRTTLWNLCLYPLVLADSDYNDIISIEKTEEGNQKYLQVFAGADTGTPSAAITRKIPFDPEKDILCLYRQNRTPVGKTPVYKIEDTGCTHTSPPLTISDMHAVYHDASGEATCDCKKKTVHCHANVLFQYSVTFDFEPESNDPAIKVYTYDWSSTSGTVVIKTHQLDFNKWTDIDGSSVWNTNSWIRKNKDLLNDFKRNWVVHSNSFSNPGDIAVVSSGDPVPCFKKWNEGSMDSQVERYMDGSHQSNTSNTVTLSNCSNGCQDTQINGFLRTGVCHIDFTYTNKRSFRAGNANSYEAYINYWFGSKSNYWLHNDSYSITNSEHKDCSDYGATLDNGNKTMTIQQEGWKATLTSWTWPLPDTSEIAVEGEVKIPEGDTSFRGKYNTFYFEWVRGATQYFDRNFAIVLWTHELPEEPLEGRTGVLEP